LQRCPYYSCRWRRATLRNSYRMERACAMQVAQITGGNGQLLLNNPTGSGCQLQRMPNTPRSSRFPYIAGVPDIRWTRSTSIRTNSAPNAVCLFALCRPWSGRFHFAEDTKIPIGARFRPRLGLGRLAHRRGTEGSNSTSSVSESVVVGSCIGSMDLTADENPASGGRNFIRTGAPPARTARRRRVTQRRQPRR
jgi:hypothetical protein